MKRKIGKIILATFLIILCLGTTVAAAPIEIKKGEKIILQTKNGESAAIYTDDYDNGYLVIQSGMMGIRITNNNNTGNLLTIRSDGSVDPNSFFYKNNGLPIKAQDNNMPIKVLSGFVVVLFAVIIFLIRYALKLNRKMTELSDMIYIEIRNKV